MFDSAITVQATVPVHHRWYHVATLRTKAPLFSRETPSEMRRITGRTRRVVLERRRGHRHGGEEEPRTASNSRQPPVQPDSAQTPGVVLVRSRLRLDSLSKHLACQPKPIPVLHGHRPTCAPNRFAWVRVLEALLLLTIWSNPGDYLLSLSPRTPSLALLTAADCGAVLKPG